MASKHPERNPLSRLNFPIFLVALFGVLVVVHLWVQVSADFAFGCTGAGDAASAAGCAAVTSSVYSQFLGVDLLVWGGLFYLMVGALRFGAVVVRRPLSRKLQDASFFVVGAGMLFALYLAYVQFFQLEQFCVLCLISGGTTALLFGLHVVEWRGLFPARPSGSNVNLGNGWMPYGLAAAGLLFLASADVMFFGERVDENAVPQFTEANTENGEPTAAELAEACQYDPNLQQFALFDMLTGAQAAYAGDESATVRALKVFDPNCPHCATLHAQLEPIVPEYSDRVRFYYQPVALWDFSIPQVQALYLAREHGNATFLEMMERQFEGRRQGGIPADTLVAWAEEIGIDPGPFRQDLTRGKYVNVIRSERQMTGGAGINSVPRLIYEGRGIANIQVNWTRECLRYFTEEAAAGA